MTQKTPNMAPLYGAAFGFNTNRRIKPVHFATGFFVALFARQFRTELLNNVVAFTDGKNPSGNYALGSLHTALGASKRIDPRIGQRELHALRKHLRSLANNDEAVFPIYGEREFGCDYSTASHDILTRTRDNDGFAGFFVRTILEESAEGRQVLECARACMTQTKTPLHQIYQPLLNDEPQEEDVRERYAARLKELDSKRVKRVAKLMARQTTALVTLCRNADLLVASETRLRFLVVGLCLWLFRYLMKEGLAKSHDSFVLLADASGESRMRSQSRWSYARLREAFVSSFAAFAVEGRFEECEEAWKYVQERLNGRPSNCDEFFGTLALRSGLAQPRASRVAAKHFEPQPDTLRIMILSVLPVNEGLISLTEVLERLHATWRVIYGGRAEDAPLLGDLGYAGLDQDHDLTPNVAALVGLLTAIGLATEFSDGLVMCHSLPRFSS